MQLPFSGDVAARKVELRSKMILSKQFPKKTKIDNEKHDFTGSKFSARGGLKR